MPTTPTQLRVEYYDAPYGGWRRITAFDDAAEDTFLAKQAREVALALSSKNPRMKVRTITALPTEPQVISIFFGGRLKSTLGLH